MFAVTCARCGTPFEGKTARATYCSASCRALASKDRRSRPQAPAGNVVALPGRTGASTIRAAVAKQLGGQQDTVPGRQALALADRLDNGASDGAWANLSKRLGELLEEAELLKVAAAGSTETDPIEYLKQQAALRLTGVHGAAG